MMLAALLAVASTALAATQTGKYFDNYIFVILENQDLVNVIKSPEYAELVSQGIEFLDYHGVIHPSQPNYWATIAQDTFRGAVIQNITVDGQNGPLNNGKDVGQTINGDNGDDFIDIEGVTMIADTLEAAGYSWAIYSENYPGNSSYCWNGDYGSDPTQAEWDAQTNFTDAIISNPGKANRLYKRKHNPFIAFTSVNQDLERCTAHVKSFDAWEAAVAADEFPDYAYIVPNQLDDAHDFKGDGYAASDAAAIAYSGEWIKKFLSQIQNSTYLNTRRTLIHITFDENDLAYYYNDLGAANCTETASNCPGDATDNLVYGILLGSAVSCVEDTTFSARFDHNSIVATLNDNWGLPALKNANSSGAAVWPLKNCAATTTTAGSAGYAAPSQLASGAVRSAVALVFAAVAVFML